MMKIVFPDGELIIRASKEELEKAGFKFPQGAKVEATITNRVLSREEIEKLYRTECAK